MRNILVLLVFGMGCWVKAQEGFVQLRFFYPYAGAEFTSGFALDAALKYKFESNRFGFVIKNTTLVRQTVGLELSGDWGLASADLTGEAGSSSGRRWGLTAVGVLLLPRTEITPLESVSLVFVHDSDDSPGLGFYVVDVANLGLNGQLAQNWNWNASYTFSSLVTSSTNIKHNLGAGVRGRLDAFTLGVGATLALENNTSIYGGNLTVGWQFTPNENLSARVTITSKPEDTQSLTLTSTALQPITLSASIGRSSTSGLTAGASADVALEDGWSVGARYDGAFGANPSHDIGATLGFSSRELRFSVGLGYNTSPSAQVWYSRYSASANASYKTEQSEFSLRGSLSLDTNPANTQATSGNLNATFNWRAAPLELIFDAGFQFRGASSGTAQLQLLYDLTAQFALNGSVQFNRALTGGGQNSFSFGVGVRYRF
ncbi:MAG: hypothetical protein ACK41E_02555 [Deinococcales bacterium]